MGFLGSIVSSNAGDSPAALVGGTPGTLGYELAEVENHIHSERHLYGGTAVGNPTILEDSTTPIVVTGGNGAWGTEIIIHPGTVIEGGSATKKFDMNQMYVSAVGAANNLTVVEFLVFSAGTPKAAAAVTATNKITDATNTMANNDKVYFPTIASNTGIDTKTVYFVINRVAGDFEVSLTRGGAAVDVTGPDGAVTYVNLGPSDANGRALTLQPKMSPHYVSKNAVNSDVLQEETGMLRQACNRLISCRAKATGGTNAVSFLVGLHTYPA